jgi:uncharacterized protein with PQ loop repeat
MFTQFLGTAATVYGVLGALKTLLQARQMLARRTSGDVSAGFLASYAGGYAIWLAYGLSTGSLPLIVVDTAGLFCGGLTLAVALSLRLAYPPSHLEQPQHDVNLTKTRSPGPATPHPPGLRSEMDIVSEEYGMDQAAAGPDRSEPTVSVPGLPVPEPPPARHPRPEPQLLRQELPRDPRIQHEQDPGQHLAVIQPLTPWMISPPRDHGQQRLDPLP